MKAGEAKCPKCGGGFVNVSPEYEIDGDASDFPTVAGSINGKCSQGHWFSIDWHTSVDGYRRYGWRLLEDAGKAPEASS